MPQVRVVNRIGNSSNERMEKQMNLIMLYLWRSVQNEKSIVLIVTTQFHDNIFFSHLSSICKVHVHDDAIV